MKTIWLTEAELRARWLKQPEAALCLEDGAVLTPSARDFVREHHIELAVRPAGGGMSRTPIPQRGGKPAFTDAATGQAMDHKPEEMTHLRGNLLVPKTHPRIAFRGQLDCLMADTLLVQLTAQEEQPRLLEELDQVMDCLHRILGAEVKDTPLGELTLLGMDSGQLRYASHHVRETLGIDHPIPSRAMGRMCLVLNQLRTRVREAELAAARAFDGPEGCQRPDLVEGLNRLSSCVYILFCRQLSGYYDREETPNELHL